MFKSNDDFIYKLGQPVYMASEDDDDDLFEDDEIENDESDDADLADEETNSESNSSTKAENDSESKSSGISRGSAGFGFLTFFGIIPLTLLFIYLIKGGGLSFSSVLFLSAFFIGTVFSIWTFVHSRKGVKSFNRFDLHSYFKWSEILVISAVLLLASFVNIISLYSGGAIRLSAESTIKSSLSPEPVYAPKPPANFEQEEEVLYTSPEYSANSTDKKPVVKSERRPINVKKYYKIQTKPNQVNPVVKTKPLSTSNQDKEFADNEPKKESVVITAEGYSPSVNDLVDEAVGIAGVSATNYLAAKPATPKGPKPLDIEVETMPIISSLFLGGVLCAALGYAFPLAIAGAILGVFRKFNTPFSAKVEEVINEETGEITLVTEEQTTINKIINGAFRLFVGFNIGGTVGFILGLAITIPLYFLFWDKIQSDPVVANILVTLGVVKNPDFAYASGFIVSGFMVPMIMLIVGKASPAGISISEEKIRSVYTPVVSINKSEGKDLTSIPEPAIISFELEDNDGNDSSLDSGDDFSGSEAKDSIIQDLMSEFGLEMENVFGMKVSVPAKSNGDNGKITNYEKQKVNSVLEKSLGELGNVSVQVSAELGKATIMLTDWLNLSEGMLVELDKPVSEEIDILINDVCKGKGRLTVSDNHLAVEVSKAEFSQSKN